MTSDFENLQTYRENNRLELKSALGGLPQSLWETYSAFANTSGGIILLGVEESSDKTIKTLSLPNPEKLVHEFWNTVNNRQKVNANILSNKHVRIAEVAGNRIVVIEVPQANRRDKPIYIGVNPFTGSYPAWLGGACGQRWFQYFLRMAEPRMGSPCIERRI